MQASMDVRTITTTTTTTAPAPNYLFFELNCTRFRNSLEPTAVLVLLVQYSNGYDTSPYLVHVVGRKVWKGFK